MSKYVKKNGIGVVLELRHGSPPPATAPEWEMRLEKMTGT